MDLQSEKRLLIKKLESVEDAGLLLAIKSMLDYGLGLDNRTADIKSYNDDLNKAEEEIASGYGISHDEVINESQSW